MIAKGTKTTLNNLFQISESIKINNGLVINREKSKLYISKPRPEIVQWCNSINLTFGYLPTKYLGIPLLNQRMSKALYQPLLDSVQKRIDSWSSRFLSFARRLQFVKSVLQAVATYWISSLPVPLLPRNWTKFSEMIFGLEIRKTKVTV